MSQRRYTYDELYARYQRDLARWNPAPAWVTEPERCPKCGNGAVEYLIENDDQTYGRCSWCHKKWNRLENEEQ